MAEPASRDDEVQSETSQAADDPDESDQGRNTPGPGEEVAVQDSDEVREPVEIVEVDGPVEIVEVDGVALEIDGMGPEEGQEAAAADAIAHGQEG